MTKLDAGLTTSLPASDPGSAAVWGSKRINPRPRFCLCLAWSGCSSNDDVKWVLRYSPSETKIHTLVCVSCTESFGQPCPTWHPRLNGQITNGKRSIVKVLPGSVLLCQGPVPGLLGWAYPEQLGLSSTACGLVLGDSIRPCTSGVSLLHQIASVAPLSKPQPCSNSMRYTSGTTWSTRSDGFG